MISDSDTSCNVCDIMIPKGDHIYLTSTAITKNNFEYTYNDFKMKKLCWNLDCIQDYVNTFKDESKHIYITDILSEPYQLGSAIIFKSHIVTITEAKKHIDALIKMRSMTVINNFMIECIKRKRIKKWLFNWAASPTGWDTQDAIKIINKYSDKEPVKIKRTSSHPNLKVYDYNDIQQCRAI